MAEHPQDNKIAGLYTQESHWVTFHGLRTTEPKGFVLLKRQQVGTNVQGVHSVLLGFFLLRQSFGPWELRSSPSASNSGWSIEHTSRLFWWLIKLGCSILILLESVSDLQESHFVERTVKVVFLHTHTQTHDCTNNILKLIEKVITLVTRTPNRSSSELFRPKRHVSSVGYSLREGPLWTRRKSSYSHFCEVAA